ncbi:MAG: alkylation response protein AidB-like acyl-CoA dehydrogenase [Candidatus Azotimanducaceae bacterium]|jgi:alkylation response protein AidB-like acyl-CoA dehydrogenase
MLNSNELGLLEVAEAHYAALSQRGQEIDRLRCVPQDLAEQLAAEGFYRVITPVELGGLGYSPEALCRICETLGTANGSVAWCIFIGCTSQYLLGALPSSQLEKMLASRNLITSGVFADSGTALFQERNGQPGYVINGHWRWGSGCRNATWISGGIHEIDSAGNPVSRDAPLSRAFFQPNDIQIQDNWHVSGLRGSGSSDYIATDVWLPAERLATNIDHSIHAQLPIYRFPRFALLGIPIGAICLGMARNAIDEVLQVAQEKTPQGSRRSLAMRAALHKDLAVADTKLQAARAWFYQSIDAAWVDAQSEDESLAHRCRIRAANVHTVTTAIEVIDRMYTVLGGTSVFETSCLQRHFRDAHVASQHMMVGEPVMEMAGRVMLGLDDVGLGL